jgi:hypothetical protein
MACISGTLSAPAGVIQVSMSKKIMPEPVLENRIFSNMEFFLSLCG